MREVRDEADKEDEDKDDETSRWMDDGGGTTTHLVVALVPVASRSARLRRRLALGSASLTAKPNENQSVVHRQDPKQNKDRSKLAIVQKKKRHRRRPVWRAK